MMEEVNFKNSEGLNLNGVLYPSHSNKAIIISHGFAANKDRSRLIKLAQTLSQENFAVLRFDFGGSGDSYETQISVNRQIDDLKSAIKFMRDKGYGEIGLLGESLGALISIFCYSQDIKALVLFAPVTAPKRPSIFEKEMKKELDEKGFATQYKDEKVFKISKEYFEVRESINQKEILSKIKCPVLIIHGTEDNSVPLEDSKKAMQYLSETSKLEIIKGAEHKLEEDLDRVITLSLNWFKKNLK